MVGVPSTAGLSFCKRFRSEYSLEVLTTTRGSKIANSRGHFEKEMCLLNFFFFSVQNYVGDPSLLEVSAPPPTMVEIEERKQVVQTKKITTFEVTFHSCNSPLWFY